MYFLMKNNDFPKQKEAVMFYKSVSLFPTWPPGQRRASGTCFHPVCLGLGSKCMRTAGLCVGCRSVRRGEYSHHLFQITVHMFLIPHRSLTSGSLSKVSCDSAALTNWPLKMGTQFHPAAWPAQAHVSAVSAQSLGRAAVTTTASLPISPQGKVCPSVTPSRESSVRPGDLPVGHFVCVSSPALSDCPHSALFSLRSSPIPLSPSR